MNLQKNMKPYIDLVVQYNFKEHDQIKDFDYIIPYMHYFLRKGENVYEYISLVSYEGKFCEAVYEIYLSEKSRKKGYLKPIESIKRGQSPILCSIHRSLDSLTDCINKNEIKEIVNKLISQLK
jgi:hypothetical protein